MLKIWHVARREFICTVLTRGFMIGIFLPPVIMAFVLTLMPLLMNAAPPKTSGRIAVIDRSGLAADQIKAEFSPEKLAESRKKRRAQAEAAAKKFVPPSQQAQIKGSMDAATPPDAALSLDQLANAANLDEEKAKIPKVQSRKQLTDDSRLALVIIPKESITGGYIPPLDPAAPPAPETKRDTSSPETDSPKTLYAPFEIYTTPTLDPEVKEQIERATRRAIVNTRLSSAGMNVSDVRSIMNDPESKAVTVTESGDRATNDIAAIFIPGAFLFLIWISVITAGQYLLTTTIEEKSNRVMEVLLSATSPLQLMLGKIFGQMAVGAVIMSLYAATGGLALVYFALTHLMDPMKLVYFPIFFFIAFCTIACLMAAIGSAVSDVREAQSLMGPVMITLVIPLALWMPIIRNPNSTFATVCSFLPPISPFIMVLRIAGSEPVPVWQIGLSIVLGIFYVAVAAWAAAKIFRIGVLMYGKPPNFTTLLKWIKMA